MDTIIWLVNFPATHGFAMIFTVGFALFGLFMLVGSHRGSARLRELRAQNGDIEPEHTWRDTAKAVQTWIYRVILVIALATLAVGLTSLMTNKPITAGYIHDHGVTTTGVYEDSVVTFTASNGTEYRMPIDSMIPAIHPGNWAMPGTVQVRYLPSHPQAFVIVAGS